ncbi:MAG: glycosyltransferase family 4 protein [Rhodobacter sp.]|nr:glycosyltransferase family 4 protein [Rhodobacter sp.]
MRVVQVCPYAMDRPGGVQRHVRDLAAWLESEGHAYRILAPPSPGKPAKQQGNLVELGWSRTLKMHGTGFEVSWVPARQRAAWARELRAWGAELVHLHTPWTPLLAWQMWRALGLPAVATVHATLPKAGATGPIDRYIRWAARRILRDMRVVVVPSPSPLPLLQALLPGLEAKVLPPAIDLAGFRDAAADRVPGDGLRLACLGRLEPRKGIDVLLRAWPQIAEAVPEARLTVAGAGPMRDEVLASTSNRLTFLDQPDDAAVRALLAETDLLLAPAPYGESFGLVLVEAMSAGALPVAAANPGYGSVLTGPGAALLVPPGDAAALADRVIELARAPQRTAELRAWAAAEAARVDIAGTGPKLLDLYQSVLGRKPESS